MFKYNRLFKINEAISKDKTIIISDATECYCEKLLDTYHDKRSSVDS